MGEKMRHVAFCPHCGNRTPQELVFAHAYVEEVSFNDGSHIQVDAAYYVGVCGTCDELLLYHQYDPTGTERGIPDATLVWPKSSEMHEAVPSNVAGYYSEAARIKNHSSNAFAVQIRRALEAVCDERGVSQGTLQRRLKELSQRGDIPPVLAEMTDVLRVLGNLGAHANRQSVTPMHVRAIDDFFRAVVEYVYVAPSKLADFKKRLEQSVPKQPDDTLENTEA